MPDLGGSRGLVASLANIHGEYGTTDDYLAGTAASGKDHHHALAAVRHCRGLRLLCVDTRGWICIAYADDDPVDYAAAVVQGGEGYLLRKPHIIAMYLLVKCNCKCAAMWCKTGQWVEGFDGGGVFQWWQRWTKVRRRGQRETQQSN
jgi:hypothetical protein